jgi:hypothetical protein
MHLTAMQEMRRPLIISLNSSAGTILSAHVMAADSTPRKATTIYSTHLEVVIYTTLSVHRWRILVQKKEGFL